MRAAAVQFRADRSDPSGSREALVALARAAAHDSDLVVLPEMAPSGYVFPDRDAVARVSEAPDGPTFEALSAVARGSGAWVVCGFPERDGDLLFNSAMVIAPTGSLAGVYRKTLLFEADEPWACPGDGDYPVFDTGKGRFGVGICMDLNDPGFLIWLWSAGLDVLAFPTNWVDEGASVWPYWRHRVEGSGATLVAANTWGADPPYRFSGRSVILRGNEVLASAPYEGNGVIRAELGSGRDGGSDDVRIG